MIPRRDERLENTSKKSFCCREKILPTVNLPWKQNVTTLTNPPPHDRHPNAISSEMDSYRSDVKMKEDDIMEFLKQEGDVSCGEKVASLVGIRK